MVPNDTMLEVPAPPTAPDLVGEILSGRARYRAPYLRHEPVSDVRSALRERERALFEPNSSGGVSRLERQAVGLRVAVLNGAGAVAVEYRRGLHKLGAESTLIAALEGRAEADGLPRRLRAILDFAAQSASDPQRATQAPLRALRQLGLGAADIATIAEVVAFASYQSRVFVHLDFAGERA